MSAMWHEMRHAFPAGRTAGCEGPGSSGLAFGDYEARYRILLITFLLTSMLSKVFLVTGER